MNNIKPKSPLPHYQFQTPIFTHWNSWIFYGVEQQGSSCCSCSKREEHSTSTSATVDSDLSFAVKKDSDLFCRSNSLFLWLFLSDFWVWNLVAISGLLLLISFFDFVVVNLCDFWVAVVWWRVCCVGAGDYRWTTIYNKGKMNKEKKNYGLLKMMVDEDDEWRRWVNLKIITFNWIFFYVSKKNVFFLWFCF
jgi:hypothetical protein